MYVIIPNLFCFIILVVDIVEKVQCRMKIYLLPVSVQYNLIKILAFKAQGFQVVQSTRSFSLWLLHKNYISPNKVWH